MTATTYPIPRGWRRVVRGKTQEGDKAWLKFDFCFAVLDFFGRPVRMYYCIIRRVKKGGAG
jgi:hypothetical protein